MQPVSWHDIILSDSDLTLRPFAETDWDNVYKWCNDPEVLYFSDSPTATGYDMDTIRNDIYKPHSEDKYCFMMEAKGKAIGECWLQRMNLERYLEEFLSLDLRRIDLCIGEKEYWGQGLGTRAIGLLTEFGFAQEQADMIFGCDIADYNKRSLRSFQKNGYAIHAELPGDGSPHKYDVCLSRDDYLK